MFKGNAAVAIITSINTVKEVGRMEIAPNISVDPQIHHGAPVITGTRIPVSIIVGSLSGGMIKEEVSREYAIREYAIYDRADRGRVIIRGGSGAETLG